MLVSMSKVSFGAQPRPFIRELCVSAFALGAGQRPQSRAPGEPHARAVGHAPEEAAAPLCAVWALFWVLTSHCSDFLGLL